jgi:hypothetical protein
LIQYFHDWKVLLFVVWYGGTLGTCLFIHQYKIQAKLAEQERTGRIPSTTEIQKYCDEVAIFRTTLTRVEVAVGIVAATMTLGQAVVGIAAGALFINCIPSIKNASWQ